MSNQEPPQELDETELSEVLKHLQTDEQIALESTLESVSSFQLWIDTHPALRQMFIVEKISDIGPAILKFLRVMLGLYREPAEDSQAGPSDGGGQR